MRRKIHLHLRLFLSDWVPALKRRIEELSAAHLRHLVKRPAAGSPQPLPHDVHLAPQKQDENKNIALNF